MKTYLSFNYPTNEQLEFINKQSKSAYRQNELYLCRIQILDNSVNNDYCKVSSNALEELGKCLIGKKIKIKEYFQNQEKPTQYEMRIVNHCISRHFDKMTNDNEPLIQLYVDAYVPILNISANMSKQIEDKIQGESLCCFSFNSHHTIASPRFVENIEVITGIADAYEVSLEYPCKEERKKWLASPSENMLNESSVKTNSVKKDCSGCMGAAFGDCAECAGHTGSSLDDTSEAMSNLADNIKKMANANEPQGVKVPIFTEIQPLVISNKGYTSIQLSKSEIKNLIDFFDYNMKMNLQLDDMWDGNMAYLCEMCDIYKKLVRAKEYLAKCGDDNDH